MIYLLIIIFAITKSERDLIGSGHYGNTWYGTKDYIGNSWWIENVISFLGNGWHLMDWINVSCMYLAFGILVNNLWFGLIAFVLGGTLHSYRNGSLFRKGLK